MYQKKDSGRSRSVQQSSMRYNVKRLKPQGSSRDEEFAFTSVSLRQDLCMLSPDVFASGVSARERCASRTMRAMKSYGIMDVKVSREVPSLYWCPAQNLHKPTSNDKKLKAIASHPSTRVIHEDYEGRVQGPLIRVN